MSDEIDYMRGVLEAATPGPWRVAQHGTWEVEAPPGVLLADLGSVAEPGPDAALIALLGSVRGELLAVVEAGDRVLGCHERGDYVNAITDLGRARAALTAAIARHRGES